VGIFIHAETNQKDVQQFEGAIRFGGNYPLGSYRSMTSALGANIGLDLRFNYDDLPLDFGVAIDVVATSYNFHKPDYNFQYDTYTTLGITYCSNYNFRQGYKVNPYVGAGLGYAYNYYNYHSNNIEKNSFIFVPKVGVELFYHLRFEGSLILCRKYFNCVSLTAGVVIGGRPRKSKYK
nr:hypothetical protein [Muribaculaceae bacterium]